MFSSLVCFRAVPELEESPVLGSPRLVASTIMLSALLSGVAVHQVHAQNNAPIFNWQGEVQVSTSTLTIREGEDLAYNIRLSEQPAADGWWVRIHVDGVVYVDGHLEEKGIRWVPSVGWEFNQEGSSGPTQWRSVWITALQDDDDEDKFVTITHEVWDENTNCPPFLHGVAPVEVRVTDDKTPNNPATGQPRITGVARVEQTLTAVTTNIQDPDGLGDFAYQWKADGTNITGATDSTYTLANNEVGKRITVTVSFTDDGGSRESVTSQPTAAVVVASEPNRPATGQPRITGVARVEQTLTAVTTGIQDPDGLGDFAYQWKADGTNITGATDSTYTLTNNEVGKRITVTVSFTDDGGSRESVTSQPTAAVVAASVQNRPATGQPRITGVARVEQTLTAVTTGIQDPDGLGDFAYQWKADGTNITGATDSTYTLTNNEVGKRITVTVSFTDDGGSRESVTSQPTAEVVAASVQNRPATGQPRITGAARVEQTLTAVTTDIQDPDGLGDFAYQWKADGTNIAGATDSTYTLTNNEVGKRITVTVSFTDGGGGGESVTSQPTAAVVAASEPNRPATGQPRITGGARVEQTLTAVTTDIQDPDGLGDFAYQWKADGTNIAGATDSTYTLTNNEVGKRITVTVSFTDGGGGGESVTSQPTAAVVAASVPNRPATGQPRITGGARVGQTLTAVTTDIQDPDGLGDFVYQWKADGTNIAGATDSTYTLTNNEVGKRITVTVSFTDGGGSRESVTSQPTAEVVAASVPNRPATGQPRITGVACVGQTLTAVTTDIQDPDGLGDFAYQWKADGTNIAGATDSTYTLTNNEVGKRITVTVGFTDGGGSRESVTSQPTATVKDVDTPALTVSFDRASYSTTEGADSVTVTVTLSRATDESVTIPITVTPQGATEADDYTISGLTEEKLSFASGDVSKTFTIMPTQDTDDDNETVELGFGTLPEGVDAGQISTATLTIIEAAQVELTVSFALANYTAAEAGEHASIKVNVSPAAPRRVEVPLVVKPQGGATREDYDGVPASIVFAVGAIVATFQVAAVADDEHDPGESIVLSFGDLPEAVSAGDPSATTVEFTQQRSAEQFSRSLKVMLAVVARSVAGSAQTAIQSRFERKRQLMRTRQSARSSNAGGSLSAGQAGRHGPGLSRAGALNHIPEADRFGFAPPRSVEGADSSVGLAREGGAHTTFAPNYGIVHIVPTRAVYGGYDPLQMTSTADPSLVAHQFYGVRAKQPILSQASFNFPTGESTKGNDGSGSVALWGQGDLQQFNGNLTQIGMNYRGGLKAAHVGLDFYNSEKMLIGFSFMHSWADMNYTDDRVHGMLRGSLKTAHPYLYWQPKEYFSAWVIGGLGRGQVDVNEPGRTHDFAADFHMLSGGMRLVAAQQGNTEVGVVLDSFTARLRTGVLADVSRVTGQANRTRMLIEVVHDKPLTAGRSLSVKAEFGSRHDAGDADRGFGMEAGFRLGFLDANSGLDIAWHGRVLLVHGSDYRDWGTGFEVGWDPGKKNKGLRLSTMSSVGQDVGGRTTLWNNSALGTRPMNADHLGTYSQQTRTDSEVSYGMDVFDGWGLLTPYSRLQIAGYGRDLRVGTELSLLSRWLAAMPARFHLEGIRRETPNGMIDLGAMLGISIPF